LTIAQFSILNAVWAATIVLAEVPSGALADIVGRKRLMVFATAVMIVEVGIISFIPKANPSMVFIVFLMNRVLSGLAEAAASGADEALAYDSLVEQGLSDQWGRVLEILSRFQSIGFIIAMSVGAAIYDPVLLTKICSFFWAGLNLTQETTMRFPLYLTFVLAIGAFSATTRMQEIIPKSSGKKPESDNLLNPGQNTEIKKAFALTFQAGTWILKTPFVLSVFLFGMLAKNAPGCAGVVGLLAGPIIYGLFQFCAKEVHFLIQVAISFQLVLLCMGLVTFWKPLKEPKELPVREGIEVKPAPEVKIMGALVVVAVVIFYIIFW